MSDLTRIRAERTGYRYDEGKPVYRLEARIPVIIETISFLSVCLV
jgi:hypothetical protein